MNIFLIHCRVTLPSTPLPSTAALQALVAQARGAHAPQGHCIHIDGQPCVIKWAQQKPWAAARSWLAALVCWLAFGERIAPSALRTGGIRGEAQRLRRLLAAGRSVPRVLLQTDDCLVLSSVGIPLDRIVDGLTPEETLALFARVTDDLADWHRHGCWHGGAQLRNVMLDGDRLYRIDFEERHGDVLPAVATRVYDVLLFFGDALLHLERAQVMPQGQALVRRYLDHLPDEARAQTRQCLQRLVRVLNPLVWVDSLCPWLTRRRDKQRVVRFARVVRAVLSSDS